MSEEKGKWYIIKCPSGVELKFIAEFKEQLTKAKVDHLLEDYFVPDMSEKESKSRRILMANYIFVKLILEEIVENIVNKITYGSFLLDPNLKIATTDEEIILNLRQKDSEEKDKRDSKLQVGETIIVLEAPFMDFEGKIEKSNEESQTVSISVNILGSPIFIELPFSSIKRINKE